MGRQRMLEMGILGGGGVSTHSISGIVYDADGITPVAGATVALGVLSAVSAANGTYTISGVAVGASGSMTCTKTGYSWAAITVAAMGGNLTAQNYTNAWWAAGGISASCVGAYQAKNAATQADSYVNQKTPGTLDLVASVAPAWAIESGWAFNGTTHYLRTGVVPTKQVYSMIIRFTGLTQAANKTLAGCTNVLSTFGVTATTSPGFLYYSGGLIGVVRTAASGVIAVAGVNGYFNGAAETGTIPDGATTLGTKDIYIGGENRDGTPLFFTSVTIEAIAIYSSALTQPQVDAVGDATANLPFT